MPVIRINAPVTRVQTARSSVRALRPLVPATRASLRNSDKDVPSESSSPVSKFDLALASLSLLALSAGPALADTTEAVATEAAKDDGFMGFLAGGFESFLKILDSGLSAANVPYSYGFSIIMLTFLVKLATWPLTAQQVESSLSIQALQPRIQELRRVYGNNQEKLQLETARLYKEANVNPLAGCLPTLVTLPVWIGLYRALTRVASEGLLTEGWFWIPSLAGPTMVNADGTGGGLNWLFPFENGAPPVGWADAGAYLLLPVLLIASQYASQKILSPPQQSNDPAVQQTQAILNFLPLMIGWFSLNVPSGLTLYWFTNNLLTTAQQLYLRKTMKLSPAIEAAIKGTTVEQPSNMPYRKPVVEEEEAEKKPTGKEMGARKKKKSDDDIVVEASTTSSSSSSSSGGKKGEKFRALKAREAAAKASAAAAATPAAPAAEPPKPTEEATTKSE